MSHRVAAYDRTILACPVWLGRLAGPARTWLAAEGRDAKAIGLALQSGGGVAYGGVIGEFQRLTGRPPEPLLLMSEGDFGNKIADTKVEEFAHTLLPAARG